jgi:lipopolysaccharide transport system ATP-binding protein
MGMIKVEGLGKAYKQYANKWLRLLEWMTPFLGPRHKLNWILSDISFEVSQGESVGIIGMNGAGKSTLLKMITGTNQPTTGSVTRSGRVAALLELGMGFHPEFTGRQNVMMAGQLMGFSVEEVNDLMPAIEGFAEIGRYIDEPVRTYSSGMQVRLAFSVATARRPDVLIVDEALSVGDAYFQHKSFERVREYRKSGTTLLIVSHDKTAIQSICDRAILLANGKLAMEGKPDMVMDYYNALLADHQNQSIQQKALPSGDVQTISGTGEAMVSEICLLNSLGSSVETINVGESVVLNIEVKAISDIDRLILGYGIKDRLGQVVYGTNTDLKNQPIENVQAGSTYRFSIGFNANLGPGSYSIQTSLVSTQDHLTNNYEWRDLAFVFNVVNIDKPHFAGVAWIDPVIEIVAL